MLGNQGTCFRRWMEADQARAAKVFARFRAGHKAMELRWARSGAAMLCGSRPRAALRAVENVHGLSDKPGQRAAGHPSPPVAQKRLASCLAAVPPS